MYIIFESIVSQRLLLVLTAALSTVVYNLAEIYFNKYAIEGAFVLSQQFFRGVFNNIKS